MQGKPLTEEYQCDECGISYLRNPIRNEEKRSRFLKNLCKRCLYSASKSERKKEIPTYSKIRDVDGRLKHNSVTISCNKCFKEFSVPYGLRSQRFCSKSCAASFSKPKTIKNTSSCVECGNEFSHYGEKILCSRECVASYLSKKRIGENNPAWKEGELAKCKSCGKDFKYKRGGLHSGQKRIFCSSECCRSSGIDTKHLAENKKNRDNYPREFKRIRSQIRKRDGFSCQICGIKEEDSAHHVHHIDYDKSNISEENLITLCQCCHNMTHNGRTFWEIIFNAILSGSKIVKKDWGCEVHIVNHHEYCLKYLIFFKGKEFSFHFHNYKKELWHCLYGKFTAIIGEDEDIFKFSAGDKIQIERGVPHQLKAIQNSILVEVSTQSFVEDSIRLREADNTQRFENPDPLN